MYVSALKNQGREQKLKIGGKRGELVEQPERRDCRNPARAATFFKLPLTGNPLNNQTSFQNGDGEYVVGGCSGNTTIGAWGDTTSNNGSGGTAMAAEA